MEREPAATELETYLAVTRNEAEQQIDKQIAEAEGFLPAGERRVTRDDLFAARRLWSEYTFELLKKLFTTDRLAREFDNAKDVPFRVREALAEQFRRAVDMTQRQVDSLRSIRRRLEFFERPANRREVSGDRRSTDTESAPERPDDETVRIFISHSHRDAAIAEALADLLQTAFRISSNAIRCSSVPRYALSFGADVTGEIRREVLGAAVLIGVVTQSSRESAWVLFELGARWGLSKPIIPLLAGSADMAMLPPPIQNTNAAKCTTEHLMKLVEEVAAILGESVPRASSYAHLVDTLVKAAVGAPKGSSTGPASGLIEEARGLKRQMKEIRRRWPQSGVLVAPLDRFTWGAPIGETRIDADVEAAMRFHDDMSAYAATLDREYPGQFGLSAVLANQQKRRFYNADGVLDLLDDHIDQFVDVLVGGKA